MRLQLKELLGLGRDFADSIKFLHQEEDDKMIAALDNANLERVEPDSKVDKTSKFK